MQITFSDLKAVDTFWTPELVNRFIKGDNRNYKDYGQFIELFKQGKDEEKVIRQRLKQNRVQADVVALKTVASRTTEQVFSILNQPGDVNRMIDLHG